MKLRFKNSVLLNPTSVSAIGSLDISGLSVAAIHERDSEKSHDFSDITVMPGLIDMHNHGAVGVDVNEADLDGLMRIGAFLARNGVTTWMPTLVPDSDDNYQRAMGAIDELMVRQTDLPIAQAAGVHYEGVFANEKMCGALRPEYFRTRAAQERMTPSAQSGGCPSFARRGTVDLPRLKNGVHMTTLAPEIEGGIELIKELVSEGWIVSIGHTRADKVTLERALAAGARHMTHFFNAMTGIHHRDMGVAGWGLASGDVTFDIIADGIHVHPEMLKMACTAKGIANVSLISDSVAPTGLGDGDFELWGEKINVTGGRTRNERGNIAGSVCTMLDCVRLMRSLGFTDVELARMASANPARVLGIHDRGSIEVGKRADLVGLDRTGNVAFTVIGGRVV